MPYKYCPNCFSTSYSNHLHRVWLCPNCGKDISFMEALEAGEASDPLPCLRLVPPDVGRLRGAAGSLK